ncbi:helix-turn-helix transcriptional regulator [Streptomyces sp. Ag109_O5-10]|uniref:ArsR/SmtB family transcription factor n=1 Tax=Streptomyces sp. Ag109_O5-10 TaxID=1855349 RepID=UPI00089D2CFE|nr:helix-turn-helix domain-containing protein [Streptomyces sp. Ag109_O5-10]SEE66093.1 DNA-binding transcriptional regulator, ArsR family [Streptomyces sp. Ag109_O5-10]
MTDGTPRTAGPPEPAEPAEKTAAPAETPTELTSLERAALYRSLGNPLRRRILDYLGRHGEANSTVLARELGESSGTTSYHLRKLAEQKLIEEIPEKSRGRERWWRGLPFSHTTPDPAAMTPEEYVAAEHLALLKIEVDTRLFRRAHQEYRGPQGWAQVQRTGTWMTQTDLHEFVRAYQELLDRYSHPDDAVPEGARRVNLRFYAAPDPVGEWEGEPTGP